MGLVQDLMVSVTFAQLVLRNPGNTDTSDHREQVQEELLTATCCSREECQHLTLQERTNGSAVTLLISLLLCRGHQVKLLS